MDRSLSGLGALLPTELWSELLALGGAHLRGSGAVLLRQGGPGTHVLVLVEGRVKIARIEWDGVEVPLAVRGPGEILGEIAVLDRQTRTATVTAIDPCRVHVIPGARFERFMQAHDLDRLVAEHAFSRLREAEQIRAELATLPVPQRLCRALLRLVDPEVGGAAILDLGMSQEELGRMVGASRNAVVVALGELRADKIVDTHRRRVIIRDLFALRARAEGATSTW